MRRRRDRRRLRGARSTTHSAMTRAPPRWPAPATASSRRSAAGLRTRLRRPNRERHLPVPPTGGVAVVVGVVALVVRHHRAADRRIGLAVGCRRESAQLRPTQTGQPSGQACVPGEHAELLRQRRCRAADRRAGSPTAHAAYAPANCSQNPAASRGSRLPWSHPVVRAVEAVDEPSFLSRKNRSRRWAFSYGVVALARCWFTTERGSRPEARASWRAPRVSQGRRRMLSSSSTGT